MASGWTNRGKKLILDWAYRGATRPTNFYVALLQSTTSPSPDSNVMSDHTQIATGNGYAAGGYSLTPNGTDFPTLTEDDSGDLGELILKDIVWTASGGPIPASGGGARWAVLTTDEVTVANRQILAYFDLASDRTVSDGQPLTLQACKLRLTE